MTPFPWSAEMLQAIGAKASFFGHPIKQLIRLASLPMQERESNLLAVLPGSRAAELDRHLPLVADLVKPRPVNSSVGTDLIELTLEFAVAPNFELEDVRSRWEALAPGRQDRFTRDATYAVLERARAAIVCSGTATLEAALMRCPHVVVYRITEAMAREAKLIGFKRPKFIALPNVVLDREVVPEHAGLELDGPQIVADLARLLESGPDRADQLRAFAEIDSILGPDDAITKTAELLAGWARGGEPIRPTGSTGPC